jgi:hypothetical protein
LKRPLHQEKQQPQEQRQKNSRFPSNYKETPLLKRKNGRKRHRYYLYKDILLLYYIPKKNLRRKEEKVKGNLFIFLSAMFFDPLLLLLLQPLLPFAGLYSKDAQQQQLQPIPKQTLQTITQSNGSFPTTETLQQVGLTPQEHLLRPEAPSSREDFETEDLFLRRFVVEKTT